MKSISDKNPFNEKYRKDYEFQKEYVKFIAENKELIGQTIELWTKKFPGQPAEYWEVPVNKPIWGPRYLAERIKECVYHRLRMEETQITSQAAVGNFYGSMVVDQTINRLDAVPVSDKKSVFMGAGGF